MVGSGFTFGLFGSGLTFGLVGSGLTFGLVGSGFTFGLVGSGFIVGSGLTFGLVGSGLTFGSGLLGSSIYNIYIPLNVLEFNPPDLQEIILKSSSILYCPLFNSS